MQVKKFSATQKSLSQGTIFKFSQLKFKKKDKSGELTFSQMYPETKLDKVKYGIVLSQSCDLVNEGGRTVSTPYIVVALLDPIERYFEEYYQEKVSSTVESNTLEFKVTDDDSRKLVNEEVIVSKVAKDMERFFLNNEKYFFFISIKNGKSTQLFSVNLTKTFPIKSAHSSELFAKATYQLKPYFESKLGWKLAEVYGRVGTPDYKESELKNLTKVLLKKVSNQVNFGTGMVVSNDQFKTAKGLSGAKDNKRQNFFIELMESKKK